MPSASARIGLSFAPFIVAIALFVLLLLSPYTHLGPSNNSYALGALAAIFLGLVAGVISLVMAKTVRIWWRLLIGVLYLPAAVVSLLLSGF